MKTWLTLVLGLLTAAMSGCVSYDQRNAPSLVSRTAPTLEQIKEMSDKGVSEEIILTTLRAARAVYTLTSKEVVELQQAGVSQTIIDYLLSTPRLFGQKVRRYRYYYPPYYYPNFYYHSGWHFGAHHYGHGHHYGHHGRHH